MKRTSSARAAHAIAVVESAYDLSGTEADWLGGILNAVSPDLNFGTGLYGFTNQSLLPDLASTPAFAQHELPPHIGARLAELNSDAPAEVYAVIRGSQVTCGGLVSTFGKDHAVVRQFRSHMASVGLVDGFSLFAHDGQSGGITVSSLSSTVITMPPRVRSIWRRVGIHLANALRLRRRLNAKLAARDALLDPRGKVEDAVPRIKDDRAACGVLVDAVRAMERARTAKARRAPEEALELWQGLVGGEWSLVEHWEGDGKRYVAAHRNRPGVVDPRALTPSEALVLHYVGLGGSNKEIAFALGFSTGAVSRALSQLLLKLRCKNRVDLAHLADPSKLGRIAVDGLDVLTVDVSAPAARMEMLAPAEREIAQYVMRGFSSERIARARKTAVRTIANQLQVIFAKLGVSTRSELRAALAER